MQGNAEDASLLTIDQFANAVGSSYKAICKLIHEGRLRPTVSKGKGRGRICRFSPSQIEEYQLLFAYRSTIQKHRL